VHRQAQGAAAQVTQLDPVAATVRPQPDLGPSVLQSLHLGARRMLLVSEDAVAEVLHGA
jgi:hypothetical protein